MFSPSEALEAQCLRLIMSKKYDTALKLCLAYGASMERAADYLSALVEDLCDDEFDRLSVMDDDSEEDNKIADAAIARAFAKLKG